MRDRDAAPAQAITDVGATLSDAVPPFEGSVVWRFEQTNGFAIVAVDGDFHEMAATPGSPPQVVWLRGRDYPAAAARRLMRSQALEISGLVRRGLPAGNRLATPET